MADQDGQKIDIARLDDDERTRAAVVKAAMIEAEAMQCAPLPVKVGRAASSGCLDAISWLRR